MRCGGVCFACFDLRVWCLVYVFCDCCLCVCCCRIDGFVFILLIVFSLSDCGCVLRVWVCVVLKRLLRFGLL